MSELESMITAADPSPPSAAPVTPTMFSSIGGRRKLVRALSLFKRESQRASLEVEPVVAAVVDSDNNSDDTPPASPTHSFEFTSLIDVQPQFPTLTPAQIAEKEAVWNDISYTERAFKLRVEAPPMSPLNVSPNSRESFEAMVWALLIIDQPTPANQDALVPSHSIPIIKGLSVYNISVPSTPNTCATTDRLDVYFRRTEVLVQLYTMPLQVTAKLAMIATDINGSKFARYMGSRGRWSLRRFFGGLQVLLHWWAATSPGLMMDFAKAISLHFDPSDEVARANLRAELRGLFKIHRDHDEYEQTLDRAISRGYDEISMFRRELRTVIQDAFEDLVEQAKAASVDGDSVTLSAGE